MWLCVLTGDPKMSAEQVVALCFGITSAPPSTPQSFKNSSAGASVVVACCFPHTINFGFSNGFLTRAGLRITDYAGLQHGR